MRPVCLSALLICNTVAFVKESEPLGAVLGRAARALRGERPIDTVLPALRDAGLNWTSGNVAHLEAGRVSPTVPTLFALASAFGAVTGQPLTIADLLAGDGAVQIGETTVPLRVLRSALDGKPVKPAPQARISDIMAAFDAEMKTWPPRLRGLKAGRLRRATHTFTDADARIARKLGMTRWRAIAEMGALWGHSLTAERDRIAGPQANAQRRGRISRQLQAELWSVIEREDSDGNDQ